MKVDLRKAYDSIEWQFVEGMLVALEFPRTMINWIMQCLTSPYYSLALNGNQFGFFKGRRGLRQGDPMSSLLFTICLEYFTRILSVVTQRPDLRFHPMCRKLGLSHLAFADNLLLFCRGDLASVRVLMRAFLSFSEASGLRMNQDKSEMYMHGITPLATEAILQLSGFKIGIAWDTCCLPCDKGGLGIKHSLHWNLAVLGKYTWWISQKKDTLWVKWVHHLYIKQTNWWDYKATTNSSWTWRQVCRVKDILQSGFFLNGWLSKNYALGEVYDWLLIDYVQVSQKCVQELQQWLGYACQRELVSWLIDWRCRSLLQKKVVMAAFATLVYLIWFNRNTARVEGVV
ncbi:uncharacterized protein LOC141631549 [Silene latifolia]|uniref:uncharacterized protein LOC141631549 n=1 Tax=Silene latifolia TaxID=37657 RepID=UPI003D78ACF3